MCRVGLIVSAVVLAVTVTACGDPGGEDGGGQSEVPPGARSCSDWAGRMDDGEQWDAAESLLASARGTVEDTDGGWAPSTAAIRQFRVDLGEMCNRGASDDLLGRVAVELYQLNGDTYTL